MKLYLCGHAERYAVEQLQLALFPEETMEPVDGPFSGDGAVSTLSVGRHWMTAGAKITLRGKTVYAARRMKAELAGDVPSRRRLLQNAYYAAAMELRQPPQWGSLSGVRPTKLTTRHLLAGGTEESAERLLKEQYHVLPERRQLCVEASRATVKAAGLLEENDISLYIGIPFCPTRCAYCSFVSQSVEKSMKLIPPFLEALHQEIRATAAEIRALGLRVISVYMGGGTPTTLSAEQLDRLCTALENEFDLSRIREYTVEAGRPDTITVEKLQVLRRHGVDRVSVNPQTMSDTVLEAIGRRHSAADIVSALEKVRRVGGFAVNMDLIAGLPTDTVQGFANTVDQVLALSPENVTVHTLSLKKGSRITLEGSALPTAAEVGAMLDIAQEKLRAADYAPYYLYRQKFMSGGFENVGWSREGYINLYNICIMEELCSIIAMGGGGSTKLVRQDGGRNIRIMEPKYPLEYINGIEKTCADKRGITEFYTAGS